MSKGIVLYCHGFASSGKGPKSIALIEALGEDNVAAPDLPVTPAAVEELLDGIVAGAIQKYGKNVVLVGTSLGGFWANYMSSKWQIPCVLVNPSSRPADTISEHVGKSVRNYATGEAILVTYADIAGFAARQKMKSLSLRPALKTMFLAKDDEVLNYTVALDDINAGTVVIEPDGGHRFEKHWSTVISAVKDLLS